MSFANTEIKQFHFLCLLLPRMKLEFYKYQGTGNDFVVIDNRMEQFDKQNVTWIAKLCHRKFGIGADGLLLLENSTKYDFKMLYFNADGNESTMCGNGGRCIVAFANFLHIIGNETIFEAIDGIHIASIKNNIVTLQMNDVDTITEKDTHLFLNTGSPHHVTFKNDIDSIDVKSLGASIRYGKPYNTEGTNVNFVEQINDNSFKVRTYERGVEDETLSCGTGVTAVAISAFHTNKTKSNTIVLKTRGGDLQVRFTKKNEHYKKVFLIGPTEMVFKGFLEV